MCGKDGVKLVKARIEQSVMSVCKECSSFGQVLKSSSSEASSGSTGGGSPSATSSGSGGSASRSSRRRDPLDQAAEEQLKEDYGKVIRSAREKRGMSQEDLGKELKEKVSVIKELEGQKMTPPDDLVKKLERTLEIELMEEVEPVDVDTGTSSERGMTLGDMIKREDDS